MAFVPSAGARYAPEILVLELMREIFFEVRYGQPSGTRELNAEERDENGQFRHSEADRSALHVLRGRRKKTKLSKSEDYFAPAYPPLADSGWLRKSADRVVVNFLLSGPVAQNLWHKGDTEDGRRRQKELVERIWEALLGDGRTLEQGLQGKDILAVALGPDKFKMDKHIAINNLMESTGPSDTVIKGIDDEFSRRITRDFEAICSLEAGLPRMQWIQILMTFLRFALPMWLLAEMQITSMLHGWLVLAADEGTVQDDREVLRFLSIRNQGLLHPTLTPTRELFEHVERYVRCRVEVDILLCWLEKVAPARLAGRILTPVNGGHGSLGISDLLVIAREAAAEIRQTERFKRVAHGLSIRTFIAREGEMFAAWRNPLMKGQGKNIDEFFRVLYKAEAGDEAGGYLLAAQGRGSNRGFRVFPGQMLLGTATYLAAQNKWSAGGRTGGGKLVLQDVEQHFGSYGIDFSAAADARPLLMRELQAMGLLAGSPDAGSSVAVACPYWR
jgi:hypothetical protein